MVLLDLYKNLGISSVEQLEANFQKTILPTNRTPDFFVDWNKVHLHVNDLDAEISILSEILGKSNIEQLLRETVVKHPEVLRIFPRLIAYREVRFPVIFDSKGKSIDLRNLDFWRTTLLPPDDDELEEFIQFADESGIIELLQQIDNLHDFMLGVEAGMDTNARKNRSGHAMENLLEPIIYQVCQKHGYTMKAQGKFKSVPRGISIPEGLKERKADFIVHTNKSAVNIEVNFYSAAGSKPEEIVDSYINRYHELKSEEWNFIWITDGARWSSCENQLQKAFNELECVLNIEFAKAGVLEDSLRFFLK